MLLEMFVSTVMPLTTPLIIVLFDVMKQGSQRPNKCVLSRLATDAVLGVVVVDGAMVMVLVDVGVTKIILRESGVPPKVCLPLPV